MENINEIKELKESNFGFFKEAFSNQITIVYNNIKEDIKDKINEITYMLDDLFYKKNIFKENNDLGEMKEFQDKMNNIMKILNITKNEGKKTVNSIFVKYKNNIFNSLVEKKTKI